MILFIWWVYSNIVNVTVQVTLCRGWWLRTQMLGEGRRMIKCYLCHMWLAEFLVNCWTLGICSSLPIKLNEWYLPWLRMQVTCSGEYLALIRRIINTWNWDWSSTNIPPHHGFNQFHSASFSPLTFQAHSCLLLGQFYLLPVLPFMSTYQCSYPLWFLERIAYLCLRTLSFAFSAAWETCSPVFTWIFSPLWFGLIFHVISFGFSWIFLQQ